jgi:hypothetical protein
MKAGAARVKDHESSGSLDSVLPVVPKDVLIGIRQVLEAGMEPQELAKRLGAMIDTVVGDLARQRSS